MSSITTIKILPFYIALLPQTCGHNPHLVFTSCNVPPHPPYRFVTLTLFLNATPTLSSCHTRDLCREEGGRGGCTFPLPQELSVEMDEIKI